MCRCTYIAAQQVSERIYSRAHVECRNSSKQHASAWGCCCCHISVHRSAGTCGMRAEGGHAAWVLGAGSKHLWNRQIRTGHTERPHTTSDG
jgi:hypothetical protein